MNDQFRGFVSTVKNADILIGIPSFNNAKTIGHVVKAVQAGLAKYFPGAKSVIVNSDGGSGDGTQEVVRQASIEDFASVLLNSRPDQQFRFAAPYHGIAGKGSAFRAIFEIAGSLGVKACAVVDADLRSITPEWIELLVKPVMGGTYDYVAPLYKRHKYDGTITNSIIYPLTRALYGKRIRQPIGGDFGFSGELAKFYLTKNVWGTDVARYGIDIWMTTTAIANGMRVCQSFLGAKIHDPKDPAADLSSMLFQVVGAAFDLMEDYSQSWIGVNGSERVAAFGFEYEVGLEEINVNLERILQRYRLGVKELSPLWDSFIPKEAMDAVTAAASGPDDQFKILDSTWAEIIYSFALAVHKKTMNKEHLLKSLTPLYMGKVASFVMETRNSDITKVEERIESLCLEFEARKILLIEKW